MEQICGKPANDVAARNAGCKPTTNTALHDTEAMQGKAWAPKATLSEEAPGLIGMSFCISCRGVER